MTPLPCLLSTYWVLVFVNDYWLLCIYATKKGLGRTDQPKLTDSIILRCSLELVEGARPKEAHPPSKSQSAILHPSQLAGMAISRNVLSNGRTWVEYLTELTLTLTELCSLLLATSDTDSCKFQYCFFDQFWGIWSPDHHSQKNAMLMLLVFRHCGTCRTDKPSNPKACRMWQQGLSTLKYTVKVPETSSNAITCRWVFKPVRKS